MCTLIEALSSQRPELFRGRILLGARIYAPPSASSARLHTGQQAAFFLRFRLCDASRHTGHHYHEGESYSFASDCARTVEKHVTSPAIMQSRITLK